MIPLLKVRSPATSYNAMLENAWSSGYIADGQIVREFEQSLAGLIGNSRVLALNNDSNAIILALYLAGVRPNSEVIACPMMCTAVSMPICNLFAKAVWCDCNPETGMMDPLKVRQLINRNTKAILISHWGGNVAEVDAVRAVGKEFGIKVIEDATEAFGSWLNGEFLGKNSADYTIYSFGPVKHITTGDGAAIFFDSNDDFELAKKIKRHGIDQDSFRDRYGEINPGSNIEIAGYNFTMNNLTACYGLAQMEMVSQLLSQYASNGEFWRTNLNIPGIRHVTAKANTKSANWVYTILSDRRDALLEALFSKGIKTSRLHMRNDIYSCLGQSSNLPGVESFSKRVLCIPSGWWLKTEDLVYIKKTLLDFYE